MMIQGQPSPDFRRRGQRRLHGRRLEDQSADLDAGRLLHELQVHQLELEMQNEELRHARVATETALARYTELYDYAPVGYLTLDQSGVIHQLNLAAADLLGSRREDLVGKTLRHFIAPPDRPALSGFLGRVLAGHSQTSCELALIRPALSQPQRHIRIEATADPGGLGFNLIAIDVSDKKRATEELVRSNLELQQYAYIAAHDLQTPLRSVSGLAQLLQRDFPAALGPQANAWIGQMLHHIQRMQTLIQDLLEYSRIESRGRPFESVDMTTIFDEAVAALSVPIQETGAAVTHGELPTVMGDRIQLAQVLQNLIDNAIKYRGEGPPRVHVSAQRLAEGWIISVEDNGMGIDRKHHDVIFEIFRRLHSHQTHPGTGIGLAICQRVVERHGGRIWLDSEPGQGSVFHFLLPDHRPEEQAAETTSARSGTR